MATRRSSITPQFGFNEATGQYFWLDGPNKGRFVPRTEVRRIIDEYLENKSRHVRTLAEQLRNREISIAQWQRAMEQNIARVHLANAAAAKGGWHNLTQSDYGRVGQLVREEYKRLREFGVQIENGLPLDGRFTNRAGQYAQAGRTTYENFQRREMEARGHDEERSVLHAGDSCTGCLAAADRSKNDGWKPIGSLPLPGTRECLRNCKCTMEYRKSSAEGLAESLSDEAFAGSAPSPLEKLKIQADIAVAKIRARGKPADETIKIFGEATRNQRYEVAVILNRKGEVLHTEIGSQYQVRIPADKRHLLEGNTMLHNHPRGLDFKAGDVRANGASFSKPDIDLAYSNSVSKMVVVTPRRSFEMEFPNKAFAQKYFLENYEADYREALRKVLAYEQKEAALGRMNQEQGEAERNHRIWLYLQHKMGVNYKAGDV